MSNEMSVSSALGKTKDVLKELTEPNDFHTLTWMSLGASLMLIAQLHISSRVIRWLPVLYLCYCLLKIVTDYFCLGYIGQAGLMRGRWSAKVPRLSALSSSHSSHDGSVVLFILGARINQYVKEGSVDFEHMVADTSSPFVKLAPGVAEMDEAFQAMWREAEEKREEFGYLGRTATLVDYSDVERTPTIWLSYWRDLKGLHAFALSSSHRFGHDNYNANQYPNVGIMHETYYAPKGCSEAIYHDFTRWGLGATLIPHKDERGNLQLQGTLRRNPKDSTMLSRMERNRFPNTSDRK